MSKKAIWAACLLISFGAFAAPPPSGGAGDSRGQPSTAQDGGRSARREARQERVRERFERRSHLAALLRISTALNLTDAQSLRFGKIMSRYEAKRSADRQLIFKGVRVLRRAARGDASAYPRVQSTLRQMVDARARIQKIDIQMYQELAKGLSPQKQAKLALVLARLPMQRRAMAGKVKPGRHGRGF